MRKKPSSEVFSIPHPRMHDVFLAHHTQEKRVIALCASGKMPHGLLLSGPKGVGKATFAYRIAKFLCCDPTHLLEQPETMAVMASDRAVTRIAHGTSSDVLVLEAEEAGVISVDEVRKIAHFLHLTASHSPYRIVIIDSVDALNINAANALLKLLEEPPANSIFLLISHRPGAVLPTIRSRCQLLPMQPLTQEQAIAVMRAHCSSLPREMAEKLLLLAEGRPGQALGFYAGDIMAYYTMLLAVLSPMPHYNSAAAYQLAEHHAAKAGGAVAWGYFGLLLNRLLVFMAKRAAGVRLEGVLPQETALIERLAVQTTLDKWLELWEKSNLMVEEATRANLDLKQVTLVVLDTLRNTLLGKQQT